MRIEVRDRLLSGVGSALVTALLGLALIVGLAVSPERLRQTALAVIDLPLPKSPPPPRRKPPNPIRARRAAHDPAPPALRAKATPVVAPPPIVRVPPPISMVTAQRPALGAQAQSGASNRAGIGSGAGGAGNGTGGGGDGGEGDDTPPRQIGGRLRFSDLPPDVRQGDLADWKVGVAYEVRENGSIGACSIEESSGDPRVDAATCAAIQHRFRFRPARDRDGRPVGSTVVESHSWIIERERDDGGSPPR